MLRRINNSYKKKNLVPIDSQQRVQDAVQTCRDYVAYTAAKKKKNPRL